MDIETAKLSLERETAIESNDSTYGNLQLDAHACELGTRLQVVKNALKKRSMALICFERQVKKIKEAHKVAVRWSTAQQWYSPFIEWLLDNYYVVSEQIHDIREHLPPQFFRQLPKLATGKARVHALADELLLHCDCALDEALILRFLTHFHTKTELTIGETWAFAIMLRLVLIERLSLLCEQFILEDVARQTVDQILVSLDRTGQLPDSDLSSLDNPAALIALDTALRDREAGVPSAIAALELYLESRQLCLTEIKRMEQHRSAASQVSIGNIITSMRLLSSLDWSTLFEKINSTEQILRRDPLDTYAQMDFASRNRYRNAIEELARGADESERQIAMRALTFCERGFSDSVESIDFRRHIGYWLVDAGRAELEQAIRFTPRWRTRISTWLRRHPAQSYFFPLFFVEILLLTSLGWIFFATTTSVGVALVLVAMAVIPASEIAVSLVNTLLTRCLPVDLLPKLELIEGVPESLPTFLVVPAMLSSHDDVASLVAKLENHYLANMESEVCFALLTDWLDSNVQGCSADQLLLNSAIEQIRRLNVRYHKMHYREPFFLFHRQRLWNEAEQKWMGWERKRGKLMEFGKLLTRNVEGTFVTQVGDLDRLDAFRDPHKTPLIITLDADSILPRGAARKLIGTLAHPLNRSLRFSSKGKILQRGYSILQPRISIHLGGAPPTRYHKIHANHPGVDPYTSATSDLYQDLFREGSFTGKGIFDLRMFESSLEMVFPENRILSHDLIEGCHCRVALASDIEIFDGFPSRYDADVNRNHRWVRGDWQIAAWLFNRVPSTTGIRPNRLSVLSRWKILDNLRRSLVAPTLLAFLLMSWYLIPGWSFGASVSAALVLCFPLFLQTITGLLVLSPHKQIEAQLRSYLSDLFSQGERILYSAIFLPHKAWLMTDAVFRTLYRLAVSKTNLLEWEASAASDKRLSHNHQATNRQLLICTAVGIGVFFGFPLTVRWAAIPWISLWLVAPIVGKLISRPVPTKQTPRDEPDARYLSMVASATWAYFERYVNREGNWLPPDNVQEYPRVKTAFRISPTNEGMFLVSGLAARRLGFAGVQSLVDSWERNLESWFALEQLHGHHLNWYDTRERTTLSPRYISTVDSGNLMACYLTFSRGIDDLIQQPLVSTRQVEGVQSSLDWLETVIAATIRGFDKPPANNSKARVKLDELTNLISGQRVSVPRTVNTFRGILDFQLALQDSAIQFRQWLDDPLSFGNPESALRIAESVGIVQLRFEQIANDIQTCLPWLATITDEGARSDCPKDDAWFAELNTIVTPGISLRELAVLNTTVGRMTATENLNKSKFLRHVEQSSSKIQLLLNRMRVLQETCEAAAHQMDFAFLYRSRRKLFSIGYNVETSLLDRGHYDLLCSECRLASYLAIAKGDVATEHWFHLGRQATEIHQQFTLLSWGGTMFEFLLPSIFQRTYVGSMIEVSCKTAIARQIEYGQQQNVPWGISESAYSAISANSDYQYKSFGVPGLGLKRGLSKSLVVSPYSTALALPWDQIRATANLRRLAADAFGNWGFYDAIDFTRSRLRKPETSKVVRSYMAHHQAMTLLSIVNCLENNIVQDWFHANPIIRANELMLQERVPNVVETRPPHVDEVGEIHFAKSDIHFVSRRIQGHLSTAPRTLMLSNGKFNSMMTHCGGGYCKLGEIQATRWRSDATSDSWGTFLYLRDLKTGKFWSTAYQPTCIQPDEYETLLSIDKGEIRRRQGNLESIVELVVSPEHNAEVRQLRLINHGTETISIEVTSYAEISLASPSADLAHPAFQKLFVETEFNRDNLSIIARRRPRDTTQNALYAVHSLAVPEGVEATLDFETSRAAFLGRCRTTMSPAAMYQPALTQTVGAVLDPIFSLRCVVVIPPAESITLAFTTAMADNHQQAIALADLYHDLRGVQRAFELAWAFAQVELRHLDLSPKQIHLFQQLGGFLLYPDSQLRGDASQIAANRLGQNALWRFGISGDVPILLARIGETIEIDFVRELVSAHFFLKSRGLQSDLVVCNDYPGTYFDALQEQIQAVINEKNPLNGNRQSVFLLRSAQLTNEDHRLMDAACTVLLHGKAGSLSQQLAAAGVRNRLANLSHNFLETNQLRPAREAEPTRSVFNRLDSTRIQDDDSSGDFANGYGKFIDDGNSYEISTSLKKPTPAPWSNIIASPGFGCLVTESGGGFTWLTNSRENKLTTWSNDPVTDAPSEVTYLRDEESGHCWSATNLLGNDLEHSVVHGQGFSRFIIVHNNIESETTISIDPTQPIKFIRIRLTNMGTRTRQLSLTYYAETVLGVSRELTLLHQVSSFHESQSAICMNNGFHPDFSSQVAFLSMLPSTQASWTGDRRGFLGRNGSWSDPQGLNHPLDGRVGAGLDPCLALQQRLSIPPGEFREVVFLFGAASNQEKAMELIEQFSDVANVDAAIKSTINEWDFRCNRLIVSTPNAALDVMVNRWLPYQVLSCRVWGRSAFYQSGGAYGFRDQLQDVMALVYTHPAIARAQILLAASRQYLEGDVQHWWHPPNGKGTRTRFSDDFLFLPAVLIQYLNSTGDWTILDEIVSYLESPLLTPAEQERYEQPNVSTRTDSLLEHCKKAIRNGMRYGQHGLPLMGCGDWNDGMNKVGEEGKGESVWVGWFQMKLFTDFATMLDTRSNDGSQREFVALLRERVTELRLAMETQAWDGNWYRRAFFDDGTPLGSQANSECQIDSLAQSWSVIATGKNERSELAFQSAVTRLTDEEHRLMLLFTPPFDRQELNPGYIQGYVPGVRENGGQYTHAACWMIQAATILGHGESAMQMFDLLNPILHADSPQKASIYKLEPYAVAADVYSNPQHRGRGGWSWYTGSAAWMYRVAIEDLLGIKIINNILFVHPQLPHDWTEFSFTIRRGQTSWQILVQLVETLEYDQQPGIDLTEDDQTHEVSMQVVRSAVYLGAN